MTYETDAAQVAAEQTTVPETQADQASSDQVEATPRGAIDRAFDAIVAFDEDNQPEATSGTPEDEKIADQAAGGDKVPDAEQDKGTSGSADAALRSPNEAPNRFSSDAKDAWMAAPLPVRAEVRRMEREFEAGIEKYRGDAEAFGEYRQFADMLAETGQTFDEVLSHYVGIENELARDPIGGLDVICRNLGTSLQDVAAQVLNEPPDDPAHQEDPTIDELRSEIADLQSQLGGLTSTFLGEKSDQATQQIETFSKDNPRFDELSSDIAFFLTTNRASGLQEAYEMAERLNPAPAARVAAAGDADSAAAQTRSTPAEAAQTRKGQLSVTGAPGTGSNPASRQPPETARASIDNAFAVMGIG